MRGPKPKPTELKRREGNPGKRPLPVEVVVEAKGLPDMPEGMPPDAEVFWQGFVPSLERLGIVDRFDRWALELLAVQYARILEARRMIEEEGLTAIGSTGQTVEHPAVKIENRATTTFFRMLEHYCGTPVARARAGMARLEAESLAQTLAKALGG